MAGTALRQARDVDQIISTFYYIDTLLCSKIEILSPPEPSMRAIFETDQTRHISDPFNACGASRSFLEPIILSV